MLHSLELELPGELSLSLLQLLPAPHMLIIHILDLGFDALELGVKLQRGEKRGRERRRERGRECMSERERQRKGRLSELSLANWSTPWQQHWREWHPERCAVNKHTASWEHCLSLSLSLLLIPAYTDSFTRHLWNCCPYLLTASILKKGQYWLSSDRCDPVESNSTNIILLALHRNIYMPVAVGSSSMNTDIQINSLASQFICLTHVVEWITLFLLASKQKPLNCFFNVLYCDL